MYRRGGPLVDPDTGLTLGYEAIYLGTARVLRGGEPTTVELTSVTQEVGIGDKLLPAGAAQPIQYAPHAPQKSVQGRVMSIYGSAGRVAETARHAIVTLNRGRADGLEIGHVLALYRHGGKVIDATMAKGDPNAQLALPDERYGLLFVFRVFERISYALVMRVTRPVTPLDVVQNP